MPATPPAGRSYCCVADRRARARNPCITSQQPANGVGGSEPNNQLCCVPEEAQSPVASIEPQRLCN
eukprot:scaffold102664_cov41-Prasinocladus_malaysianus.AAC.1